MDCIQTLQSVECGLPVSEQKGFDGVSQPAGQFVSSRGRFSAVLKLWIDEHSGVDGGVREIRIDARGNEM